MKAIPLQSKKIICEKYINKIEYTCKKCAK